MHVCNGTISRSNKYTEWNGTISRSNKYIEWNIVSVLWNVLPEAYIYYRFLHFISKLNPAK